MNQHSEVYSPLDITVFSGGSLWTGYKLYQVLFLLSQTLLKEGTS